MDGHGFYPMATRTVLGRTVHHRTSAYLNNRLEQDPCGIKGRIRCKPPWQRRPLIAEMGPRATTHPVAGV